MSPGTLKGPSAWISLVRGTRNVGPSPALDSALSSLCKGRRKSNQEEMCHRMSILLGGWQRDGGQVCSGGMSRQVMQMAGRMAPACPDDPTRVPTPVAGKPS